MLAKIFYSLLVITMLFGCENNQLNNINQNNTVELENADMSSYTIDMSYNDLKTDYSIEIKDSNTPIEINFTSVGKDRQVSLLLFYDYEQIPFKTTYDGQSFDNYSFDIRDGESKNITVYLPEEVLTYDDSLHKLMISFVGGSDINASSLDGIASEFYGVHKVLDLVYSNSKTSNAFTNLPSLEQPLNYYDFNSLQLILNMDYENEFQKDRIIKSPEKEIDVKAGETIELMYNISNLMDYEDALLITTIGLMQTPINDSVYKWVDLEEHKTSNGKISITAPTELGKYDVISYIIYDPFNPLSNDLIDKTIVYTNPRFTLNVLEK